VTVRGNGEFTGKITATSGTFKGTVQAESFIGDVANAQVFSDISMTASTSAARTMTYTDSSATNLVKHVTVLAMIQLRVSATGPDLYKLNIKSIGSNTNYYVPAGNNGLWRQHAVRDITTPTVTGSITITGTERRGKQ
jgi:hypothetical protein